MRLWFQTDGSGFGLVGLVRFGWFGLVWFGSVWLGWFGLVWFGLVWFALLTAVVYCGAWFW